ncbi:MAG: hypothetical protein J5592_01065 [Clostridia bacterium]|nr:hypothetical protein [Clostridia bacterium]
MKTKQKSEINNKKSGKRPPVLLIVICAVVGLLAAVIVGFILCMRLPVAGFYRQAEKEFKIPDIDKGFIPQGIAVSEEDGNILVCGYWDSSDHASPVYVLSPEGDLIASAMLADTEGNPFTGHAGGLTQHGKYVYLAGSSKGCVYVFDYSEIAAAGEGGSVRCLGQFDTKTGDDKIRVSFTATDGDRLWVGEYYKEEGYKTPDTHKTVTESGEKHGGIALAYAFSDAEDAVFGLSPVPSAAISLPDIVQGLCFYGSRVFVSCSSGLSFSHINSYSAELADRGRTFDIFGLTLPIFELDSDSILETVKAPPMSEEIIPIGGRLYIMCEAASNKYFFGKLTGARFCYSYPVGLSSDPSGSLWNIPNPGAGTSPVSHTQPATPVRLSFTSFGDFDSNLDKYIASVTDGKQNWMASPLSFKYALALLTAGASGDTKAELLSALGMRSEDDLTDQLRAFSEFSKKYDAGLESEIAQFKKDLAAGWIPKGTPEPFRALRVANSVWRSSELIPVDFRPSYSSKISTDYSSEFFTFKRSDVIGRVNDWANKKTEGMIPRLLPDTYDTSELAVILMNALYFKDSWAKAFAQSYSVDTFTAYDGSKVKKSFITSRQSVPYYRDEKTELVSVAMTGGVRMVFVLGDTDGVFDKLGKAKYTETRITIPELDVETNFTDGEFVGFLKDAGVNLVFDRNAADLSGMFELEKLDGNLYVSDIIQKTKLKLDKDGVEAAAVTAIMVGETTAVEVPKKPVDFTADRPFAFFICAESNGERTVLFEGRIVN